jgi:hypothetical protein
MSQALTNYRKGSVPRQHPIRLFSVTQNPHTNIKYEYSEWLYTIAFSTIIPYKPVPSVFTNGQIDQCKSLDAIAGVTGKKCKSAITRAGRKKAQPPINSQMQCRREKLNSSTVRRQVHELSRRYQSITDSKKQMHPPLSPIIES